MERQRASRKLLPDAFSDVSVIKCSHYRLIGTSMSQVVDRIVFYKMQFLVLQKYRQAVGTYLTVLKLSK